MADLKLSPFAGIDNVTGDPNGPQWSKDAVNVEFDRDGGVTRRRGFGLLLAGVSSPFGSKVLDSLVGVLNGELVTIDPDSLSYNSLGSVADADLEYVEINNELVFAGLNTLGVVRQNAVQGVGVEDPPAPLIAADSIGGLSAGRYGVLITYVAANGEESAASAAEFVDVVAGGGIEVSVLPVPLEPKVDRIRIYRTTPDGEVFYHAASVTLPNPGPVLLGAGVPLSRACETRHMTRMRPGRYLRAWRGRLLVARGGVLYFSEPMRYGLRDPLSGFVQFPRRITFVQPVEGGIFVGQPDGVLFLSGDTPGKLEVVQTGAGAPVPGTATVIDGTAMSLEGADAAQRYAVWVSERGYAIGQPNGAVVEPQGKRLRIPVGQYGATAVYERRLLSVVS